MRAKKRSPETIYEAKSAYRSHVDGLRRDMRHAGKLDPLKEEELRRIDGALWPGFAAALRGPYDDWSALDFLLRFLAEDSYSFGSGYVKETALRRLGRWDLRRDERRRIAWIVLNAVDGPTAREFRRQCKAARLADREILVPGLLKRIESSNEALRQRAYCAGVGMFEGAWPRGDRHRPAEEVRAQISAMRERLLALPESRLFEASAQEWRFASGDKRFFRGVNPRSLRGHPSMSTEKAFRGRRKQP